MLKKALSLVFAISTVFLYSCGGSDDNGSAADSTDPAIVSVSPAANATGVLLNNAVAVVFSEAMEPTTITTSTITVMAGATSIGGTVSYSGTTASFTPSQNLTQDTLYTVTISETVTDANGNDMSAPYSWSFTTLTPSVSFAASVQPILDANCIECHSSAGIAASTGLIMTSGASSYANLVDAASTVTTGGGDRVEPGDSADSVLYQRISTIGLDASEAQMPLDGPPYLSETDQNTIKTWIDEGALNN